MGLSDVSFTPDGHLSVGHSVDLLVLRLTCEITRPLSPWHHDLFLAKGDSDPLADFPPGEDPTVRGRGRALNISRMKELMEPKRWALTAALVHRQLARAFDDGR
jgi:hypothetical protein